jgi:hypothetical protein
MNGALWIRRVVSFGLIAACFVHFPRRVQASSEYELMDLEHFESDDLMPSEQHSAPRWDLTIAPVYEILTGPHYEDFTYGNGPAVEGGLYYQVHRLVQIGLEGGYAFGHTQKDVLFSFEGIDFAVEERLQISRITPCIRVGDWMKGPWKWRYRPYLQAGAGWYELYQDESLKIEANRFLFRDQLFQKTNDYLGANAGAGIDVEVYPSGVVGIYAAYHRVFSNPTNLQFFTPSLRFSYLF